jgi:hypothetical protein
VVQNDDAGRDSRVAACEIDPRGSCARHSSVRSMAAPRSRRRSSMRS